MHEQKHFGRDRNMRAAARRCLVAFLALGALAGALTTSAQAEKKQIKGTDHFGPLISKTVVEIGDAPNHQVIQQVRKDKTTSPDADFDGTEVMYYTQEDTVAGTGTHRGYAVRTFKNGDSSIVFGEGTSQAKSTESGSWEMTLEGTWQLRGATGKYQNYKGSGTYQGKMTPEGGSVDWEGEIEQEVEQ